MKDLHDNYGSIEIMYQLDAICLDVSDVPIHFVGGQLELTNGEFFWSREQNGPTVQYSTDKSTFLTQSLFCCSEHHNSYCFQYVVASISRFQNH